VNLRPLRPEGLKWVIERAELPGTPGAVSLRVDRRQAGRCGRSETPRYRRCRRLPDLLAIVLPLIRPILVTVAVIQSMGVWNDFVAPSIFISSPEKQTIILQVYRSVGQFTTDWPMFVTINVIALVPTVIFFVALQKHIVSGLVGGSIKG
jgi:hypothetical protein